MALSRARQGTIDTGFQLTWEPWNAADALRDYDKQFIRWFGTRGSRR